MRWLSILTALAAMPATAQVVEKFPGSAEPATIVGSFNGRALYGNVSSTVPLPSLSAVVGGTVATANAFQTVLSQNLARRGCLIVNNGTATLLVGLGATPSTATAIPLPAGASFGCGAGGVVVADQISVTSAVAGTSFVIINQ